MSLEQRVKRFVERKHGRAEFRLDKLAGDASDRSFHRISFVGASPQGYSSAILMELGQPWTDGELPYLNVRRFMEKIGLPVPALYDTDLASGFILIEDFGDVTLEDAVRGAPRPRFDSLYEKAVDLMLRIQVEATRLRDDSCVSFSLAFDVEKLMFEFDFFYDHALLNYKAASVSPEDERIIKSGFLAISEKLAGHALYLNHRDYHSRNIMVAPGDRLCLVDFQDARLGPVQYDLVSLVMDSYVPVPEDACEPLCRHCLETLDSLYGIKQDPELFTEIFDYMTIQRCIKAAGSFAYLDCVKMKNRYLKYFVPCLSRVRTAFERRPELGRFHETLSKYTPEIK
ncbi:MAG TPA: phosphotransferase [bacterium]|nr:phosphotransferase [bacterium]